MTTVTDRKINILKEGPQLIVDFEPNGSNSLRMCFFTLPGTWEGLGKPNKILLLLLQPAIETNLLTMKGH